MAQHGKLLSVYFLFLLTNLVLYDSMVTFTTYLKLQSFYFQLA